MALANSTKVVNSLPEMDAAMNGQRLEQKV